MRCCRNTNALINEHLTPEIKKDFVEKEYFNWLILEEFGSLTTPRNGKGPLKTVIDYIIVLYYSLLIPVLYHHPIPLDSALWTDLVNDMSLDIGKPPCSEALRAFTCVCQLSCSYFCLENVMIHIRAVPASWVLAWEEM